MSEKLEWHAVTLEEIAEITGGGTPKREVHAYWNGNIPWATPTDITNNNKKVIEKTAEYITEEGLKNSSAKLLPAGTVLMTSRATIGYCAINTVPMATNQGFANFICKNNVYNLFLLYLLTFHKDNFEKLGSGSTFKEVAKSTLKSYRVEIPPLPEQRKIAAILSSVDEAIEKTEAIIEQTEKVKKGLMQQLLTKGIGHTRFKKTEIGEIPKEWEVRRLEEVTLPKEGIRRGPFGGALKKEIFVNEGYAVYEQQHVINNNMREFRYFIDEKKFLEMKQFEVIPGDILISCSGTVGKVALVPENAKKGIINQALLRLRLKNKLLSNLYAWYLFSSDFMQSKMTDMSHGSTLKNIVGMTELRKISIPIPPLDEQMEIVSILTSVDQMHQNELQRLSQLQNIKKGLMQSLLTGKVRVRVDEDEVMSS